VQAPPALVEVRTVAAEIPEMSSEARREGPATRVTTQGSNACNTKGARRCEKRLWPES
jgi:hypothetical protein